MEVSQSTFTESLKNIVCYHDGKHSLIKFPGSFLFVTVCSFFILFIFKIDLDLGYM